MGWNIQETGNLQKSGRGAVFQELRWQGSVGSGLISNSKLFWPT